MPGLGGRFPVHVILNFKSEANALTIYTFIYIIIIIYIIICPMGMQFLILPIFTLHANISSGVATCMINIVINNKTSSIINNIVELVLLLITILII